MPPPTLDEQRAQLAPYIADPVRFAAGLLGHRTWWRQRHLLRSVARHRQVAVKANHKSSKTFAAAELVLWWLLRWSDGKVITTSPTFQQIKRQLWPEIRRMSRDSLIRLPEPLETELFIDDERFALGRSAKDELAAAGWSGHILFIIDEAPGVSRHIFEALKGVRAGGRVHILMLGNPTVLGGPYQDAFTKNRRRWHTITMSAFDTPKVRPLLHPNGRPDPGLDPYGPPDRDEQLMEWLYSIPASKHPQVDPAFRDLCSPEWIIERWEDDGPGSIDWEARVMGRFPRQGEHELIPVDALEAHQKEKADPGGPIDLGIDVAGPGDNETVVAARSFNVVLEVDGTKKWDPDGWVVRKVRNWDKTGRLRHINVDRDGLGEGLYKILRRHWEGRVHGIRVGLPPWGSSDTEQSESTERFANLKAQLYWGLRMRATSKEGICGLDDAETVGQLGTIRWALNPRGQTVIERKEQRARRGLESPDRAEALMLAFAEPPVREVPDREPIYW